MVLSLGPSEKLFRPSEFHLLINHLPGSTMPLDLLEYLDGTAPPFTIRRVVVRYIRDVSSNQSKGNGRGQEVLHGPSCALKKIDVILISL